MASPPAPAPVASPPPAQPPAPRVVQATPPSASADLPPGTIRILPPAPAALPTPVASAAPSVGAPPGLISPPAASASADGLRVEPADQPVLKVTRSGAPDTGFMRMHEQYVQKAKAGGIDLYMLGDSIIDFWQHRHGSDWDKHFANDHAGDFGISGDRTEHVLWRIDNGELDGLHPKAIVLLIGTNNLASNAVFAADSVDETYAGIKAILDDLRRRSPDSHILLMAVFPREDKPLDGEIDQLNKKLPALADGEHIRFLNINDQLTDSTGKLLPGVMLRDRLHPDDKGYDIWAKAMQPLLAQWLGAGGH
ncbi:MAG TPA: GDSL-type esterase/lipase family protein [Phycisphaerae bacterium]|nr:GDSL-type esterase/lipase family protein [Phycisphaerae bacterium]